MSRQIKTHLNDAQQEAVSYDLGPSILLAGAGSGKTRVLIHKVIHLISHAQVDPQSIVMITFTNKAAGEMKTRIQKAFTHVYGSNSDVVGKSGIGFVGTFHSLCAKILRAHGHHIGLRKDYVIYTDRDQQDLIKQVLKKIDGGRMTPSFFLNRISEAKNQLITPENFLDTFSYYKAAHVAEVYWAYQSQLTMYHAVDFDDLLMHAVRLLRQEAGLLAEFQSRYSHLMIDEFQDTNIAQYALAKLLTPSSGNITVVGDFSQAIYSWRGADIRNLERFTEDFPTAKTFYLEQNYRSTQQILDYAYSKIIHNQTHPILKLFTHAQKGEEVVEYMSENEEHEALYVGKTISALIDKHYGNGASDPYAHFAVLYRTNAQSRILEEVFLKYGIPYTLVGGTRFYDRKEVRDVIAYLRLIVEPNDPVAFERVHKLGKRKLAQFIQALPELQVYAASGSAESVMELTLAKTNYLDTLDKNNPEDYARIENIRELKNVASTQETLTDFFEQIALIENEYSVGERSKNKGRGVRLMSLHASKGLEFDNVFITGLEDGLLPHVRSMEDSYMLEEERRLFYVGITRARLRLFITWAKHRGIYGRRTYGTKSRFITSEKEIAPYDPDPSVSASSDDWDW